MVPREGLLTRFCYLFLGVFLRLLDSLYDLRFSSAALCMVLEVTSPVSYQSGTPRVLVFHSTAAATPFVGRY